MQIIQDRRKTLIMALRRDTVTGESKIFSLTEENTVLDTYALPASINRSAITAFWQVNSPKSGILHKHGK